MNRFIDNLPTISYSIRDGYLVIRISRRTALKTKIRGYSSLIEQMVNDLPESERPLAYIAIALTMFRCRDVERYLKLLRRSLYEPNLKKLVFCLARYYVNMHSILQNLATRVATLLRYILVTLR